MFYLRKNGFFHLLNKNDAFFNYILFFFYNLFQLEFQNINL